MTEQQLNIKELWGKILFKTGAVDELAKAFDRDPRSMQSNWFSNSGRWSVPKRFGPRVISILEDRIAKKL